MTVEVNVLNYILRAIPKNLKRKSIISFFSGTEDNLGFSFLSLMLMKDLQKVANESGFVLSGDGVYVEMDLEDGYEGFTLFGNYYRDDDMTEEGDAFFYVDKTGKVTGFNYD